MARPKQKKRGRATRTARPRRARSGEAPGPRAGARADRPAAPDSLAAYLREIARFHPLSPEEEKVLGRRIQAGDQEALQRLVEANLRFVVSYAKRYRGLGLSFLDLIHEGTLGLIEAGKRFDPERNVKFISYAVWWVRQALIHALTEHTFRLPAHVGVAGEALEPAPAAPAADEPRKRRRKDGKEPLSLSTLVGDDGELELGDVLAQAGPTVEVDMIRSSTEEQIRAMVADLDEKERDVIRMRFGLDGEDPRTLQEIGDVMGLSRERVRQIESRAKERMRRSQRAQSVRGVLN